MRDILAVIISNLEGVTYDQPPETTQTILLRLPLALHARLKHEAYVRKTSMNKLAVAKLTIIPEALDTLIEQNAADSDA